MILNTSINPNHSWILYNFYLFKSSKDEKSFCFRLTNCIGHGRSVSSKPHNPIITSRWYLIDYSRLKPRWGLWSKIYRRAWAWLSNDSRGTQKKWERWDPSWRVRGNDSRSCRLNFDYHHCFLSRFNCLEWVFALFVSEEEKRASKNERQNDWTAGCYGSSARNEPVLNDHAVRLPKNHPYLIRFIDQFDNPFKIFPHILSLCWDNLSF